MRTREIALETLERNDTVNMCEERGARARQHVSRGLSTSAKSFFVHHTQQLIAAAQVGDAMGIRMKITEMKMRLIKDALKATGRGSTR